MRRGVARAVLAFVSCSLLAASPYASPQAPLDAQPVFRLSVSLVQLDAVVTDRKGHHVTDLGPDAFVVLQDGQPQPVTAVAYIRADEPLVDDHGVPLTSAPVLPRDARRVIAVVVDDARMSFGSIARTRTALRRFVDEQLHPDDLVTIITTSARPGTSWPFTFGRAELRAAASRLRYSLWNAVDGGDLEGLDRIYARSRIEDLRQRSFAIDAMNRIADVIDAVRELPGRKTIVLVSEGFAMFGPGDSNNIIRDGMRRLVDRANRAAVVVYAIDPRGLVPTGLTAADDTPSMNRLLELMAERGSALRETQDGLRFVAAQTGGFAVVDQNDIPRAFGKIMADQEGYYLIGYQPAASTFGADGARQYRSLKVKVTRKGLRVRARTGFYGVPTE
jgi:VWFA-related protein